MRGWSSSTILEGLALPNPSIYRATAMASYSSLRCDFPLISSSSESQICCVRTVSDNSHSINVAVAHCQATMNDTNGTTSPSPSLLILPEAPSEASSTTFRAAFEPALIQCLSQISERSTATSRFSLDIALTTAFPQTRGPRCSIYPHAQHIIGLLYRLCCIVCTEEKINLEYDNEVDIRIFLIDNVGTCLERYSDRCTVLQGPIIDLATLCLSQRPWRQVYAIESEQGEEVLQKFVNIRRGTLANLRLPQFSIQRLSGGMAIRQPNRHQSDSGISYPTESSHYSVAVGGTFDHLHAGHKLLLTATALIVEPSSGPQAPQERYLTVGITGDVLLRNKRYAEVMETWEERQEAVCRFLLAITSFGKPDQAVEQSQRYTHDSPNGKSIHHKLANGLIIKCVEISDPYGPTITDESITALVVSGETRSGGKAVNEKRAERGWSELAVFEVDVLDAQSIDETFSAPADNFRSKISSTEIRRKVQERLSRTA